MLTIPTDLDRWHPNDVTAWLRQVEDDDTVTEAEAARAGRAVMAALLGHVRMTPSAAPLVELRIPRAEDPATDRVLTEVAAERVRQNEKFGQQDHRDGTGPNVTIIGYVNASLLAHDARDLCQRHTEMGIVSWLDILAEEVAEAFAEDDPVRLRAELLQVAAVAVAWAEAIDRRAGGA